MFELMPMTRNQRNMTSFWNDFEKNFFGDYCRSMNDFKTDIIDNGDSYLLQAELPGYDKSEIGIKLAQTISSSSILDFIELSNEYGIAELKYPDALPNQVDIICVCGYDNYQRYIKNGGLLWPLFYTAVYYLVFTAILTLFFRWLEKKLSYFKV